MDLRDQKLQIDLGDSIPPSVGKSFNVLIPFILLLSGFGLISAVLNNVFDTNLIQMITTLIQEPLRTVTTGLVGCVILYSLGNFLWLLGIHQSVIYSSILEPLLIVNMTQNMAAYAAGEAIPNHYQCSFGTWIWYDGRFRIYHLPSDRYLLSWSQQSNKRRCQNGIRSGII